MSYWPICLLANRLRYVKWETNTKRFSATVTAQASAAESELVRRLLFAVCRHKVLRIVPKDDVQLSLMKDLEETMEFEVFTIH